VLITGGAGFIGCSVARRLIELGSDVAVLDNLHPQVHAALGRPPLLPAEARLVTGDVTHPADWHAALTLVRPEAILHLAAETGTGQSLTESSRHGLANVVGTTQMLDALRSHEAMPRHIVLASSRAVYGEGAWASSRDGSVFYPGQRTHAALAAGHWNPSALDGSPATPLTSCADRTMPNPTSVYGATKLAQEHVLRAWAQAFDLPVSVLRFQNVYGPGQSLSNPYTGIVALFSRLALGGGVIDVYEDGDIARDFVYIDDIAQAVVSALRNPPAVVRTLDIGSGTPTTVLQLATTIAGMTGAPPPQISGRFRDGDVRAAHCSIEAATADIGYTPAWPLERGLAALLEWVPCAT
jgi:dTDP-L-rhamnose 4-epimerase